jgi:hypothetical protein
MKHWIILVLMFAAACSLATAESELPPAPRQHFLLADAVARGVVSIRAHGGGVRTVTLEVTARADVELVVPAGTFFRAANVQNMVVMKTATVHLDRGTTQAIVLATACASFHRPAPSTGDRLELAVADPELQRLAACLEHQRIDDGRKQTLVWKVTDGVEREQALERRDNVRPYLVDSCARRMRRDRCERIVDATYEVLVDKLFSHRAEDERICGMPAR